MCKIFPYTSIHVYNRENFPIALRTRIVLLKGVIHHIHLDFSTKTLFKKKIKQKRASNVYIEKKQIGSRFALDVLATFA